MRPVSLVACVFALGALLVACVTSAAGGGTGASKSTAAAAGPPLRAGLAREPQTADPAKADDLIELNVVAQIHAGLTRYSGDRVVPALAEGWRRNSTGSFWTFTLRSDARWSDGTQVTAPQIREAWLRALRPATRSAYAGAEMMNIRNAAAFRRGAVGAVAVGIAAPDDRTLTLRLEHPVPWLHEQLALPVFAAVHPSAAAHLMHRSATADRAVTSGPYSVSSWTAGGLVLTENPHYTGATGRAAQVRMLFGLGCGAVRDNRVDVLVPRQLSAPGFNRWASGPDTCGQTRAVTAGGYLWFGTRRPGVSRTNVRRAIAIAVDRRRLAAALPGTGQRPLMSSAPRPLPGSRTVSVGSSLRDRPQTAAARRLMGRGPSQLSIAWVATDAYAPAQLKRLRADLRPLGIRLRSHRVATTDLLASRMRAGRYDLALLGWGSEFLDAYNLHDLFTCTSNYNLARWCDPKLDSLMKRAVRTMGNNSRWRIERQVEARLMGARGGFPAAPLFSDSVSAAAALGAEPPTVSPLGIADLTVARPR